MKKAVSCKRSFIYCSLVIFFLLDYSYSNAQLSLVIEQGDPSDYNINVNYTANTDHGCACYAAPDTLRFFQNGNLTPLAEEIFQHTGTISGSFTIPVGIDTGGFFFASVKISGGTNPSNCQPNCIVTVATPLQFMSTTEARPPENFQPTYLVDGGVSLVWENTTDIPNADYQIHVEPDLGGEFLLPGGTTTYGFLTNDNTDCYTATDIIKFQTRHVSNGEQSSYNDWSPDNPRPFPTNNTQPPGGWGSISGTIKTVSGNAVEGVTVKAHFLNNAAFGGCWPDYFESNVTQGDGVFNIPNLYRNPDGIEAQYEVEAFLAGHQFRTPTENDPDSTFMVTMQTNNYIFENRKFVDLTTYDITGAVKVPGVQNCGLKDVSVRAVGVNNDSEVISTSGDGQANAGDYTIILPEPGIFNFISSYRGIDFDTIENVNVLDNMILPDIIYNLKDTIRGFSGAGCLEEIGEMEIVARTEEGCMLATVTTNASGFYEMVVPTIPLKVGVEDYDPQDSGLDLDDVLPAIDSIYEIDFDSTLTLNIQYRKPITIDLDGLPPPPCASTPYPVLNQDEEYTIRINIWESLDICRADTGSVMISDNISTFGVENPIETTIPFSQGKVFYTFKAGDPALGAPYLKNISITAFVDNEVMNVTIPVIVSGTRIRTASITSAPSDSIPFLILRDPPGDNSKAWFSQNSTISYNQSFSHEKGGTVKIWAKAKPSFLGIIWGEIAGSLEVGGFRKSATETTVNMEVTDYFETSSLGSFIGEDGDLIMGAAVNFQYGLSDDRYFDLNTCSMVVDTSLVFSPETFESSYRHSVKFIKENILPELEFLSQSQDIEEDERKRFASRLQVWEQILQLNRDQKRDALVNAEIFSFDAGASQTSTITGSSSRQSSLEFTTIIDANIAVSAGVKTLGFEGEAGVAVNIRSDWGNSTSETNTSSTTTGYTFADDDAGDNHFFKFAIDSVYGTPVFEVIGGASSCPHEENTQFIDLVKLTFSNPVFIGQAGEEFADFHFTLQNLGETSASNDYILDLVDDSNPGATVTFNGNQIINPGIEFLSVPAGAIRTGTIRVTRPAGDQYAFEGIEFEAFSGCFAAGNPNPDRSNKSTATISAYFMNNCSNINLTTLTDNWLVNQQSGNLIPITMDQYVIGNIDTVRLMYANQRDGTWMKSNIEIIGSNLLPPPQVYNWDISTLVDGDYSIRWELICGSTYNYSPRVQGKIDRKEPRVFGVEKPNNDLYFPGDEISVRFNEPIDYSVLSDANVYLKAIPEGTYIPVQLQGVNNEIIIVAPYEIKNNYNQTYEAGVFGIVDMFGNPKLDTTKWEFVISEPDSDRDGVPDTQDRCPGGDDFKDTDMDGLPDDCDCLTTIPENGKVFSKAALDFDGIDDQIIVASDPMFDPDGNSFTFEAWVNATDDVVAQTILSKGNGSLANTSYIFSIYQNKIALQIADGSQKTWIYSDTDFPFNEWTHVAVNYNSNTNEFNFYLNGEADGTRTIPHGFYNGPHVLYIGRQGQNCNCNFYKGQMDEVRMWSTARSAAEIKASMNTELLGMEANLNLYFDFNEGIPFADNGQYNIEDKSINNHLTILNFSNKTGTTSNWVNSPMYLLGLSYDLCINCPDTINAAMDFDGVDDQIVIPHDPAFNPGPSKSFTFEAWVKADSGQVAQTILSKGLGFSGNTSYIFSLYQDKIALSIGDGSTASWIFSDTDVKFNEWMHAAVSYDHLTNSFTFYFNGKFDGNRTFPHGFFGDDTPLYIGRQLEGCNCNFYKGQMDDIRIWNQARTEAEIAGNLYTELIGDENGLLAYYNFNNGLPDDANNTITSVPDVTGNGHDGVLENFYQFGLFSNWVPSPLHFGGDEDEDGRPDICDNCIPEFTLTLDNQFISGTYIAKDKIILGNNLTFDQVNPVYLRAPEIEVLTTINIENAEIYASDKPCN